MSTSKRILSGMRPTNPKGGHLGNYEGALRNWVNLQNEGYDMFCMVADWHALTTLDDTESLAQNTIEITKDYVAAGIDPSKSAIFVQSHVKEHAELHVLFSMVTPLGWLERTPTYKEKVRDKVEQLLRGSEFAAWMSAYDNLRALHTQIDANAPEAEASQRYVDEYHRVGRLLMGADVLERIRKLSDREIQLPDEYSPSKSFGIIVTDVFRLGNAKRLIENHFSGLVSEPYGLLGYPVLQTADILLYRPYGVPVGRDQAPHLEIGNDIGIRFNRLFNQEVFQTYKYLIPEDETRAKLPGLDMRKMSKSYDNCIFLSETEDETAAKVKSAYTTPSKIKKTDPGIPEGCAVCQYLKIYSPDWESLWDEDRKGERGCMQNKSACIEAINEYFRPIRERRNALSNDDVQDILKEGAKKAREVAGQTMADVRSAMGLLGG